jgi:hypothetical protein
MRSNRCGWLLGGLVAAALIGMTGTSPARAAPEAGAAAAVPALTKVTVVDPPADDRVLVEAGIRIRSELDAAGLSNRTVTCAGGVGSAGCDATASAAAIALSRQDGLATIRVVATLPDGYELHRLIRVSDAAGGDDPSVLAVRAVELLRDIYLDIPRDFPHRDQPRPAPAPAAVAAAAPASAAGEHRPLRIFLGAAMLQGERGLGPAVAPVFGVAVPIGRGLSLSGTAAGPFDRLVGDARTGTATTTQALATFGARYELTLGRFSPFAALATGVHYIRAEGNPIQGMNQVALSDSSTTPLLAFGAGILAWLRGWLALTAQMELFYTQPMTDVVISNVPVGRAGGPSLLVQLGLAVSLGDR